MRENSPCKDCANRHTACHDSCEKYKEWRARYQAQQQHLDVNKNRFESPWTASRERRTRNNLKFGAGGCFKQGGMQ